MRRYSGLFVCVFVFEQGGERAEHLGDLIGEKRENADSIGKVNGLFEGRSGIVGSKKNNNSNDVSIVDKKLYVFCKNQ